MYDLVSGSINISMVCGKFWDGEDHAATDGIATRKVGKPHHSVPVQFAYEEIGLPPTTN